MVAVADSLGAQRACIGSGSGLGSDLFAASRGFAVAGIAVGIGPVLPLVTPRVARAAAASASERAVNGPMRTRYIGPAGERNALKPAARRNAKPP